MFTFGDGRYEPKEAGCLTELAFRIRTCSSPQLQPFTAGRKSCKGERDGEG